MTGPAPGLAMQIRNSVALVTGANRGLGLAFAESLLAAGARKVYAAARDPSRITLEGVTPVRLDITDEQQVGAAVQSCGDVTLLINNAGVAQRSSLLEPHSAASMRAELDTNFFGTWAMSRAFARVLKANGGGALVNMLSVLSWLSIPELGAYCASKSAAWSLTNGLRKELRSQGTLVVGVHASYIDTDMASHIPSPKISPREVARQVLEAIEEGREEVLADPRTRQVKAGFTAEPSVYLREL
jgi:NAD(P)-dependent dehydrogenase (short-subunit alcohol dehydrogenase family)